MPDAIPRVEGAHHRGIGEVAEPRAALRRGRVVAVKVNEAIVHASSWSQSATLHSVSQTHVAHANVTCQCPVIMRVCPSHCQSESGPLLQLLMQM